MTADPTAQAAYRVPRSEADAFYVPGEQSPVSRAGVGTVVSVDSSNLCTVLINDEEVTGVMWLGFLPPVVDDVVEVEMRGDLLVVPATNDLDSYLEGTSETVEHIVSSDDPGSPPPEVLQIGGSMRSVDAWAFWGADTANWARELSASGTGMRAYQLTAPPGQAGILWSEQTFNVQPGVKLTFAMELAEIASDTTAQAYVLWGSATDTSPLPTDPGVLAAAQGSALALTPTGSTVSATVTVPATVTFPVSGVLEPATARLGVRLVGTGTSEVLAAAASATATPKGWPLGSQWMNPDAPTGGLPTFGDSGVSSTNGTLATTTADTAIPFAKKAVITAPDNTGGVAVVTFSGAISIKSAANSLVLRLVRGAPGGEILTYTWTTGPVDAGTFPFTLRGSVALLPGEEVTVIPTYAYAGTSVTIPHVIIRQTTQVDFFPGAVRSGGSSDSPIRYWDGDSWRPEKLYGAVFDLSKDATTAPPVKTNTTTSCNRSASTLHAGSSITLTSTVAPTTTGTVTFYRATATSGPWTSLGAVTLSGGKATKTWATSVAGSYYFKATFGGSTTHNASSSAVTPATVWQKQVTKTVTLPCSWVQAYDGSGVKLNGTSHDSAVNQGQYSSSNGNTKSLLRFDHGVIPDSATISSVSLICKSGGWDHWYNNSGGTLVVGSFYSRTAIPATWPTGDDIIVSRSTHAVDVGGWTVNLSSWALGTLARADFTGITIGPGDSTSLTYYGYSATPAKDQFTLKVTYSYWE